MKSGAIRPRDAASLVIHKQTRGDLKILLGRRPTGDRFMPDVYVFPGGRVDPGDATAAASREMRPTVQRQLQGAAGGASPRALAIAAIRETFEETGLVVGRRSGSALEPDLHPIDFLARAITPAGSHIRYHARFFAVEAAQARGRIIGNGELLDLAWVTPDEIRELPVIDVTTRVVDELVERLLRKRAKAPPLIHYRQGRMAIKRRP